MRGGQGGQWAKGRDRYIVGWGVARVQALMDGRDASGDRRVKATAAVDYTIDHGGVNLGKSEPLAHAARRSFNVGVKEGRASFDSRVKRPHSAPIWSWAEMRLHASAYRDVLAPGGLLLLVWTWHAACGT